jgi:hypothetical protein
MPADLVAFAHAALFSPALSTLAIALEKGFLTNFPGLTPALLRKHPHQSIPMVKGHLDQSRKNQRSTKLMPELTTEPTEPTPTPTPEPTNDIAPASPTPNERHNFGTYWPSLHRSNWPIRYALQQWQQLFAYLLQL